MRSGADAAIDSWRSARLAEDRFSGPCIHPPRDDVTMLAYSFGTAEDEERRLADLELALRETNRLLGIAKATLVVNDMSSALERFRSFLGLDLRIDVDPSLKPGDIVGFSRNMIRTLPRRFDTPYVLNVHPDGFPLRPGLEEFIGRWDYIGGPWESSGDDLVTRILLTRGQNAGNGGFALRTRKICELGAGAYNRLWKAIPDCYLLYEDVFFTRFLPRWQPGFARKISLAPEAEAAAFSFSGNSAALSRYGRLPLGFHSWRALRTLVGNGLFEIPAAGR